MADNMPKSGRETAGKQKFWKSRKFRYGSTATAFTVAFIALVIFINAIFSALATQFTWYVDMTAEQLYSISEASHTMLNYLGDRDDVDIHIIFCTTEDKLSSTYYQKLVHECALMYEREFDFVTVDYYDILTHPSLVNKYKTTAGTNILTSSIIVSNEATDAFRIFTINNFFTLAESDGSVFALSAELKLTSAFLALVEKNPIAYFTTNHGEKTDTSRLWELLETAGYDVRTIDLTQEEIDRDEAQLLIINGPRYDFMGYKETTNEIAKVSDFLDGGGNMMIFMDPVAMATREMPNLDEFLEEWGIAFDHSLVKDPGNSISVDGTALVSTYASDEKSGANLVQSLRNLTSPPKTIVPYASPIKILWKDGSHFIDQSSRYISTVLYSSPSAASYAFESNGEPDGEDTPTATGPFPLMVLTEDLRYLQDEAQYSFVLACGTTEFISARYVESNAYGNADVIYAAMKAMGKVNVPADIDLRLMDNNALDLTTAQAYTWTAVLAAGIPLVCAAVGIAVYVRRRHL